MKGEGNGRAEKWFGGPSKTFIDVDVKLDPLDKRNRVRDRYGDSACDLSAGRQTGGSQQI